MTSALVSPREPASSVAAKQVIVMLCGLQSQLVEGLSHVAAGSDLQQDFRQVEWLRNQGRDGGGLRLEALSGELLNRASANISQVHYAHSPHLPLASANALSSIVHPANPFAPSVHLHISWTELKNGTAYWRLMADLNPSTPNQQDQAIFESALQALDPALFDSATEQGQKYFFIPSHQRHRGVSHFYLENFHTADFDADLQFAHDFGKTVIKTYLEIVQKQLIQHPTYNADDVQKQLQYHSLYFFQVLLLDRGTTAGLLVHDQNDIDILGSLPAYINRMLFESWQNLLTGQQQELLLDILKVLPDQHPCPIESESKLAIAHVLRTFYKQHPQALSLQASGNILPPTIQNHSHIHNHHPQETGTSK